MRFLWGLVEATLEADRHRIQSEMRVRAAPAIPAWAVVMAVGECALSTVLGHGDG